MTTDAIIHVGYGKTATTWIQEEIFNSLGDEVYLGKRERDYPSWLLRLHYLDDFAYHAVKAALKLEIANLVNRREKVIISSEAFTNFGAIYQQADRIKYIFESPRIFFVLRDPVSWIVSNYKYCVEYENFSRPLESYLDFGERRTPFSLEKRPPFYIPDLYYDEVIRRYRELFGEKNVLVLKYEDFVSDPAAFGSILSGFIGIDLRGFGIKAERKYLVSKSPEEIKELRKGNLKEYIHKAGYASADLKILPGVCEILSAEVEERMRRLLAPHCKEYYPELSD